MEFWWSTSAEFDEMPERRAMQPEVQAFRSIFHPNLMIDLLDPRYLSHLSLAPL
jgi:hypothetical protein